MKCYSPISVKGEEGSSKERRTVPCGRCSACLSNRRTDWTHRLLEQQKVSETSYFITLTYNDSSLPMLNWQDGIVEPYKECYQELKSDSYIPTLWKEDFQKFMKRLRKKSVNKLKYFCCGEYGDKTFRPHYHMILFNAPWKKEKLQTILLETWQRGMVDVGSVNEKSIRYTTGYIIQQQGTEDYYIERPFSLMSKGLGENYVERMKDWHLVDYEKESRLYKPLPNGRKARLSRYYRDKIFTKSQHATQRHLLEKNLNNDFNKDVERYNARSSHDIAERHRERVNKERKGKF